MPKSRAPGRRAAALRALVPLAAVLLACASQEGSVKRISDVEILLKRGDGFYFTGSYEEAAAEYGRALEIDPRRGEAYLFRGHAFVAMGRLGEARRDFDRAVSVQPENAEAHLARGALSYRQGRYADAIDDFDRAIELDSWNAEARYYKALACEKVGRLREAVESYKAFIHCSIPREDGDAEHARERIRELEGGPLR